MMLGLRSILVYLTRRHTMARVSCSASLQPYFSLAPEDVVLSAEALTGTALLFGTITITFNTWIPIPTDFPENESGRHMIPLYPLIYPAGLYVLFRYVTPPDSGVETGPTERRREDPARE